MGFIRLEKTGLDNGIDVWSIAYINLRLPETMYETFDGIEKFTLQPRS